MNDRNADQDSFDGVLPETVCSAIISSSDELARHETWVPARRGPVVSLIPRFMSLITKRNLERHAKNKASYAQACGRSLNFLSYLPADIRISIILDMSVSAPQRLEDMISLDIPREFADARYNLLNTLGVFARHGLVEEVFTADRIREIGNLVEKTRKKSETKGEEQ